ncbi:MAG: L-histidine N(alpha)-methyltransferase [Proteobacteria bacterium]|nr:L-histidine N(alpha)-methyltransferase [Pseudomonadota bacterium]
MKPTVLAARDAFAGALTDGLRASPKRIAAKYFYDATGSELFEEITELPEYYPTRTELSILRNNIGEIAAHIGDNAQLVEFGAGSLRKVRLLLDAMDRPRGYVPVDISGEYLLEVATRLEADYPHICVNPVVADFTKPIALGPLECTAMHRIGFFPGSTIGNFTRLEAVSFLRSARRTLEGAPLLIGVDLVKDPDILHAAYNDSEGVTAAFNLNLLLRANREADADFDPAAFAHHASYNPVAQRMEMYLISRKAQRVQIGDDVIAFAEGEAIHTEDSHKYTLDSFRAVAAEAGYRQIKVWTDPARLFSVQWLQV